MQALICFCIIGCCCVTSVGVEIKFKAIIYNNPLHAILDPHCLRRGPMTEEKVAAKQQLRGDPLLPADYK